MECYIRAKEDITMNQTKEEVCVLNYEDEVLREFAVTCPARVIFFSSKRKLTDGFYYADKEIFYAHDGAEEVVIHVDELNILGEHNYENVMSACAMAVSVGVPMDTIRGVLRRFQAVEHRIEYVRTLNKRDFYNDSKSTNTDSTVIAVNSFKRPTILIMGGLDRGHSFENLNEHMKNVKLVVCYGETKARINTWCESLNINCIIKDNLIDATNEAYNVSEEGDVILLSPGCASWDQYKCFEDRGNEFKETVNKLN
jgi:UDP-N-acetylmuramoylalanine--D-glutamate ligase